MAEKQMTERQRYWLNHVQAVQAGSEFTVEYARTQGLKAKDLYQWKTKLSKLKFYDPLSAVSSFVPVKAVKPSKPNLSAIDTSLPDPAVNCTLVFPNGLRLAFQGELSPGVIRELVTCASGLA